MNIAEEVQLSVIVEEVWRESAVGLVGGWEVGRTLVERFLLPATDCEILGSRKTR